MDVHERRNASLSHLEQENIPAYLGAAFFKPITAILSPEKSLSCVYINKDYSSVGCLVQQHYKEIPSGACGRTDWDRCNQTDKIRGCTTTIAVTLQESLLSLSSSEATTEMLLSVYVSVYACVSDPLCCFRDKVFRLAVTLSGVELMVDNLATFFHHHSLEKNNVCSNQINLCEQQIHPQQQSNEFWLVY